MSSKPELIYFDARGLAEIVRLVLTAAGIEFTETDLTTREEFLALQPDLLFKQVPLLRTDGQNLVQSNSIVRHVARKANLLGKKEPEITKIDMLYEGSRDVLKAAFLSIHFSQDPNKMEEHRPTIVKYLTIFNKVLEENGTGYFVGSSLTLADLGVLEIILAIIDYFGKEVLNDYPAILKHYSTVTSLERIAKYIIKIRKPCNTPEVVATVKKVLNW